MKLLGVTFSACPECQRLVPAKVRSDGKDVFFRKFCPEHGESEVLVRRGLAEYLNSLRYVKPAWIPLAHAGDAGMPCTEGCGFCTRHEQHLCMPIIEITEDCDLLCPICINSSGESGRGARGGDGEMTVDGFRGILDSLLASERQIDVLNLSGGEPLMHPRLAEIIDECLKRPEIVRVSVSTNGLALLRDPGLADMLKARDAVVSLQHDGFSDEAYRIMRGKPLAAEKREILDLLDRKDITASLTMTAAAGLNDAEIPAMIDLLFKTRNVVSLMIQPMSFAGRGAAFKGTIGRLTIPDVVGLASSAGNPHVKAEDFVPLPCSHPLCFSLAFYLMLDGGGAVSVNRLVDAATTLDCLSNRVVFGLDAKEHEQLRSLIYDLWSGPAGAVPESKAVLKTLKGILKELPSQAKACCFDARKAFGLAERKVKSIFIHAFQDADTFDLARVRRCCQAYPQADGRLVPACVLNVRGGRK